MTAPDLSPAEAAIVARFDAAPTPPEVLREQVAAALWSEAQATAYMVVNFDEEQREQRRHDRFLRLADAALAVFRGQQDPAVQRVLDVCQRADRIAEYRPGLVETTTLRAAIAGDGR